MAGMDTLSIGVGVGGLSTGERAGSLVNTHMDASQPFTPVGLAVGFVLLCVAATRGRAVTSVDPLGIRARERDLVLDTTFVVAFLDAEVTLLTPTDKRSVSSHNTRERQSRML